MMVMLWFISDRIKFLRPTESAEELRVWTTASEFKF